MYEYVATIANPGHIIALNFNATSTYIWQILKNPRKKSYSSCMHECLNNDWLTDCIAGYIVVHNKGILWCLIYEMSTSMHALATYYAYYIRVGRGKKGIYSSRKLLRVLKKGSNPQEEKSDLHEEKKNPQEEKKNLQEEKSY